MKNSATFRNVVVKSGSHWFASKTNGPELISPSEFDPDSNVFRSEDSERLALDVDLLRGFEYLQNPSGQTLWSELQVTLPCEAGEIYSGWGVYSIGDQIVDEREPGFPISNTIDWIEVRIGVGSWDLYYVFTNGIGIDHRDVCQKVDEGVFRIVTGGAA